MPHLCKDPSTGHLLKGPSGHLLKGCDCTSCANTLTLAASGFVKCPCNRSGGTAWNWLDVAPNETVTLTKQTAPAGFDCYYTGPSASRYSNPFFGNTDCNNANSDWRTCTWYFYRATGNHYFTLQLKDSSGFIAWTSTAVGSCVAGLLFESVNACDSATLVDTGSATVSN